MASSGRNQTPPQWLVEQVRLVTLSAGEASKLRPLTAADADLMAAFFAGLTPREIYYFFALDEAAARRLATDAAQDPAYRLIATGVRDGQEAILGYMFLDWSWQEGAPPTYGACLREGVQSRGLGRAMIDHLLGSAARSGVERAQLTVHADNWRALRLYQRAGFRMTGEQILNLREPNNIAWRSICGHRHLYLLRTSLLLHAEAWVWEWLPL